MRLKLVPQNTNIQFINKRLMAFALSIALVLASIGLFFSQGLNLGIDFRGGILIEIGLEEQADLNELRGALATLDMGDVAVKEFGEPTDIVIRVEQPEGGEAELEAAKSRIKDLLRDLYGTPFEVPAGVNLLTMTPEEIDELMGTEVHDTVGDKAWTGISIRRDESVGPKVSGELVETGILAVLLAVGAVLVYIWLRFEWQFGVGAVVALVHDVVLTIGFFSLTQLEFNLSIIAALLTIVGYSLNDTVVVYDRVRENLRRFRKVPLPELFNTSVNETLSRTVMTSVTTLLALGALFFFGGEVIRGFTAAMIWGIFVGTYSSIFVAVPFLLLLDLDREAMVPQEA
ncbi:MAG: protein translocase subunit SecF [Proteobacteria bacterium]|nr:protein translocase subunit SecF [Pseudomonadota bacterium]